METRILSAPSKYYPQTKALPSLECYINSKRVTGELRVSASDLPGTHNFLSQKQRKSGCECAEWRPFHLSSIHRVLKWSVRSLEKTRRCKASISRSWICPPLTRSWSLPTWLLTPAVWSPCIVSTLSLQLCFRRAVLPTVPTPASRRPSPYWFAL